MPPTFPGPPPGRPKIIKKRTFASERAKVRPRAVQGGPLRPNMRRRLQNGGQMLQKGRQNEAPGVSKIAFFLKTADLDLDLLFTMNNPHFTLPK